MQTWEEVQLERGRQQGKAEGNAEARANVLLRVLAKQGIPVDDNSRQRILSCTDITTLDQWIDRALSATRLSDVLGTLTQ